MSLRLRYFILPFIFMPSLVKAVGPLYKVKDVIAQQEFDNVYQQIRQVQSPQIMNTSSITVSNYFSYLSTGANFGLRMPQNANAVLTAGGGLAIQTWYWKIYAVDSKGNCGIPTGMLTLTTSGGNQAATLSWNGVEGADHYAITRHPAKAGPDGYSTTTATVFIDTGGALIAGNPYPQFSTATVFANAIVVPASQGAYAFFDYVTGGIKGYIQGTSAGEMFYYPGVDGTAAGHHLFGDSFERQMVELRRWSAQSSTSDARIGVFANSNYYGNMYLAAGSSIAFIPNSNADNTTVSFEMVGAGLNFNGRRQATFLDSTNSFGGSIRNPTHSQRCLSFGAQVSSVAVMGPDSMTHLYNGVAISSSAYPGTADFYVGETSTTVRIPMTGGFFQQTLAQLNARTPLFLGELWTCSNCTATQVCVSTGTGTGAYSSLTSISTHCN